MPEQCYCSLDPPIPENISYRLLESDVSVTCQINLCPCRDHLKSLQRHEAQTIFERKAFQYSKSWQVFPTQAENAISQEAFLCTARRTAARPFRETVAGSEAKEVCFLLHTSEPSWDPIEPSPPTYSRSSRGHLSAEFASLGVYLC